MFYITNSLYLLSVRGSLIIMIGISSLKPILVLIPRLLFRYFPASISNFPASPLTHGGNSFCNEILENFLASFRLERRENNSFFIWGLSKVTRTKGAHSFLPVVASFFVFKILVAFVKLSVSGGAPSFLKMFITLSWVVLASSFSWNGRFLITMLEATSLLSLLKVYLRCHFSLSSASLTISSFFWIDILQLLFGLRKFSF